MKRKQMFRKKSTDEGSNFWISYADLMAGLLFVFILLIGAIVSKSIILKSHLHEKEDRLAQISQTLETKEAKLEQLNVSYEKNIALLGEKEKQIDTKDKSISENKKTISLKEDEIKKLNKMLLQANTQQDILSEKVVIVQKLLNESNATLQKKKKRFSKMLKDYKGQVIVLSDQLSDMNQTVENKDKKLLKLLECFR